MSGAGEVLENPISGQRIIIRRTARETGGEFLEVESVYTKPVVHRPPGHYHPYQEERFEVISGTLRVGVGGGNWSCARATCSWCRRVPRTRCRRRPPGRA